MKSDWIIEESREIVTLYIKNRKINAATLKAHREIVNPATLAGCVIYPIDPYALQRFYVIYRSTNHDNGIALAPLRQMDIGFVNENKEMFQHPMDIQMFYDIVML